MFGITRDTIIKPGKALVGMASLEFVIELSVVLVIPVLQVGVVPRDQALLLDVGDFLFCSKCEMDGKNERLKRLRILKEWQEWQE